MSQGQDDYENRRKLERERQEAQEHAETERQKARAAEERAARIFMESITAFFEGKAAINLIGSINLSIRFLKDQ